MRSLARGPESARGRALGELGGCRRSGSHMAGGREGPVLTGHIGHLYLQALDVSHVHVEERLGLGHGAPNAGQGHVGQAAAAVHCGGRSVSRDASGFAPCSPGPEAPARLRSEDVQSRRGASRVPRQRLSSSRSHRQSLPHPADASLSRSPYILLRSSPCRPRSSCRLRPSVSRPLAAPPVSSASRLYRSPTGPPLAHWRAPHSARPSRSYQHARLHL